VPLPHAAAAPPHLQSRQLQAKHRTHVRTGTACVEAETGHICTGTAHDSIASHRSEGTTAVRALRAARIRVEPAYIRAAQFESSALEHLVEPLADSRGYASSAAQLAESCAGRCRVCPSRSATHASAHAPTHTHAHARTRTLARTHARTHAAERGVLLRAFPITASLLVGWSGARCDATSGPHSLARHGQWPGGAANTQRCKCILHARQLAALAQLEPCARRPRCCPFHCCLPAGIVLRSVVLNVVPRTRIEATMDGPDCRHGSCSVYERNATHNTEQAWPERLNVHECTRIHAACGAPGGPGPGCVICRPT
jgi:hypothetical protein